MELVKKCPKCKKIHSGKCPYTKAQSGKELYESTFNDIIKLIESHKLTKKIRI